MLATFNICLQMFKFIVYFFPNCSLFAQGLMIILDSKKDKKEFCLRIPAMHEANTALLDILVDNSCYYTIFLKSDKMDLKKMVY